jgi:drug/metabolite transporter (DMT)-like permease
MQGEARPDWNWAEFLCIQMAFGTLWAGLGAGLEQAARPGQTLVHFTPLGVAALLYVAIGPSIIAYRMWGLGVQRGGPALAGLFGNLQPVFAALLSAPLLGEWPHLYHGAALALILAGIWVSTERSPVVTAPRRA